MVKGRQSCVCPSFCLLQRQPTSYHSLSSFFILQVFYAITRLVLQTKKETSKESGTREGTIRVGKGSGGKKKKCC